MQEGYPESRSSDENKVSATEALEQKIDEDMSILLATLAEHSQKINWPNKDPYLGTLSLALLKETGVDGCFNELVKDMFRFRETSLLSRLDPHIAPNLLRFAVHRQAIKYFSTEGYPYNFGDPDELRSSSQKKKTAVGMWQEFLRYLANHVERSKYDESLDEDFVFDINVRPNQADIIKRIRGFKLGFFILQERLPQRPSVLYPGCGMNLLLKALAQNSPSTQAPTEVLNADGYTDKRLTQMVNFLLEKQIELAPSLGIDIWDYISDNATKEWEFACSIPPLARITEPESVKEAETIAESSPENIYFYEMDFSEDMDEVEESDFPPKKALRINKLTGMREEVEFPHELFDLAFSSTTTYMLENSRRSHFIYNMARFTKRRRPIINQDFATPDLDAPNGLRFEPDIYSKLNAYRTLILDKCHWDGKDPLPWKTLFISRTGRFNQISLNESQVDIDGKGHFVSVKKAIELAREKYD